MKFIFVVQGEGRGHFSQAIAASEQLSNHGHQIEKVLIGKSRFRTIPNYVRDYFGDKITYFDSPNFLPSKKKTKILLSIFYNLWVSKRFFKAINLLAETIENTRADRVVNFYEPLCGLAYKKHHLKKEMIGVAHQYTFFHPDYHFPKRFQLRTYLLKKLSKITCYGATKKIALSLYPLGDKEKENLYICPPLLRENIQQLIATKEDYLHAYFLNEGFLKDLTKMKDTPSIQLFGNFDKPFTNANIKAFPFDNQKYETSLKNCKGVISTAGFESVAEALFLGKKMLLLPVNFEQKCNAYDSLRYAQIIVAKKKIKAKQLLHFNSQQAIDHSFSDWYNQNKQRFVTLLTQ